MESRVKQMILVLGESSHFQFYWNLSYGSEILFFKQIRATWQLRILANSSW